MGGDGRYNADRELVARILAGSEDDWHLFIDRYTALIHSIVRRYVHDDDEVKTVWAAVLERLYHGQLRSYAGRSLLSTWLVVVTRSAAIDHLRSERGRKHRPDAWDALTPRQQLIYRQIFIQGRSADEVRHGLLARGELEPGESFAAILADLQDQLPDRAMHRLDWDAHAASVGAVSGRLLEYLEHAAAAAAEQGEELNPERQLHHAEARRTLERIQDLIRTLPADERRALELRFQHGWSAERIGHELGIGRRREVYTLLERGLRTIRKMLGINTLLLAWCALGKIS